MKYIINKKLKNFLFFLFLFAGLNIVADYGLSSYALENGYYETNEFSNKFGLEQHTIILLMVTSSIALVLLNEIKRSLKSKKEYHTKNLIQVYIILFGLFDIIWLFNNIYSVRLLW